MNTRAADFLKRRRFEISKERGREYEPFTIRDMAQMCDINEFTLGRLEKGRGTPTPENLRKMAPVYGNEVYEIYGQRPPMPEKIDPRLKWLLEHQDNPGVRAVLAQIEEQGEAILSHKPDKTDSHVRLVTIAAP